MVFKDISARFKSKGETKSAQETASALPEAEKWEESYRLRAKMLGVLLQDARVTAQRGVEECAYLAHTTLEEYQAWEWGDAVPSLPQLELLAYYLGVPVSHFWGLDTLEARQGRHVDIQEQYLALRNRMVGALIQQAREEIGYSVELLCAEVALNPETLSRYEAGDVPVPMHELTVISSALNKNVNYFLENSGHIGNWLAMREEWKHFAALPEDARKFAANPLNIGFIEIAIMLSQMPVDRLRRVGESVLNITM